MISINFEDMTYSNLVTAKALNDYKNKSSYKRNY